MSEYEALDLDEEEEEEATGGWLEYWFVVGGVSEKATQAIESVDGRVQRVTALRGFSPPALYAVCLLYYPGDDDQGYCYFLDDGKKARKLFIRSADESHDLYIYCEDGYPTA
jgi:hypothetical protein